MKYLLKQNKENKGILCDKITIDGFDYYVSDEAPKYKDYYTCYVTKNLMWQTIAQRLNPSEDYNIYKNYKKVIATNNPNIDIPKVINEAERLSKLHQKGNYDWQEEKRKSFIIGYNKSQKIHPFSENDMIEFAEFKNKNYKYHNDFYVKKDDYYSVAELNLVKHYATKELLQLWKEQKPKIVYYE